MRQRKRVGAFSALALITSLCAMLVATPPASAATATSLVRCTQTFAAGVVFNLPIEITTTVTDVDDNPISSVEEGQQFKVTAQATIPLSEGFIAGVLVQVPTLTSIDVPRAHVAIPVPAGATGTALTLDWAPGNIPITSSPGVPIAGGAAMTSPSLTRTFTSTADGGTNIDFALDPAVAGSQAAVDSGGTVWGPVASGAVAAAIEFDISIFGGAVAVGFDCSDGGLTQTDGPDGLPGTPDDVFAPPVIPNLPFLSVPVNAPGPMVSINSVTGQAVDTAARAGNVIDFGGPNWSASSDITVELCDLLLTTCSAGDLSDVTAAIDVDGNLTGQATVASGATTGARALRVSTDQTEEDSTDVLILGTPTIDAPGNAGLGAPITITGTNWNPGSPGTLVILSDGVGTPVAPPIPVTVSSTGSFTTNALVAAGTELIAAGETALGYPQPPSPLTPGSLWALSPFQVSANACTVPVGGDCTIQQTVLLTTDPGTLAMSQTSGIVDLGSFQLDGRAHQVGGDIQEITVVDATGSLNGWDLSATMTDLSTGDGVGNKTIPAGNMEWAPSCDPIDANGDGLLDGDPTEVLSGGAGALDPVVGSTLCNAPSGGGGGTFTGNAALDLFVPANVAAGDYTATITFLLM